MAVSWALTIPLATVLAALAALAGWTAVRGWAATLDRNGRLGVRSEASSRSEQAWTAANRVAAPAVAGAAVVAAGCAVVVLVAALPALAVVLVFCLGLIGAAVLLVKAGRLGDLAARAVPVPARRPGGASCGGCACGTGGCAMLSRASGTSTEVPTA